MGRSHVFGHFEDTAHATKGEYFFNRLPASATTATWITAHVSGGGCGDASILFTLSPQALSYFRDGVQGRGWHPLLNVSVASGVVNHVPRMVFTGIGVNKGWIVGYSQEIGYSQDDFKLTFASSYAINDYWSYCNAQPIGSGGEEIVTLLYSLPSGVAPYDQRWAPVSSLLQSSLTSASQCT